MGQCPGCGALFASTQEVAATRKRTDRCIRLQLHAGEMKGIHFGGTWIISEQSSGTVSGVGLVACPNCSEPWFSAGQAAVRLGIPESTLYLLLQREPELLRAFRVGRRWIIPQSGIERYHALTGPTGVTDGATIDRILEALNRQVEVIARPEVCLCSAYPFPHRKGGGRCAGMEQPDNRE